MPTHHFTKNIFHYPIEYWHRDSLGISEQASLYITNFLRVLAIGLIGIFLPIYLYENSHYILFFHHNHVLNGILWVVLYFALRSIFTVLTIVFFGKIIFNKLHFQVSMILSYALLVLEIYLWTMIKINIVFLILGGILSGVVVALYWLPYHIFFIRKSGGNVTHFGKKVGLRHFMDRGASSLAPLVGGIIIAKFGYDNLFIIISLFLLFAAFPLVVVVHEWKHREHKIKDIFTKYIFDSNYKNMTISFMAEGTESVIYTIFWPILMYFVLQNYIKMGFINTASLVLSAVVLLFIGKLADKNGTKKIHLIGVTINSILYIPRIFMKSSIFIYILDIIDRFNSSFYSLPMMTKTYEKAKKLGGSDIVLFRELSLHLGVVIMSFAVFLVIYLFEKWEVVFLLASLASLLTYLIEFDKN